MKNLNLDLKRYKSLIIPVFCLAAVLLLALLVIRPRVTEIPSLLDEIEELEGELGGLQLYYSRLQKYTSFQEQINDSYSLLESALPFEDNVPFLMTQVQQIASSSGVTVTSLQYSGGSRASNKVSKKEETSSLASTVRLSLSGIAKPESFLSFITAVEESSRLLDLDTFKYSYQPESNDIKFSLAVVSYYLPRTAASSLVEAPVLSLEDPEVKKVLEEVKSLRLYQVEELERFREEYPQSSPSAEPTP